MNCECMDFMETMCTCLMSINSTEVNIPKNEAHAK